MFVVAMTQMSQSLTWSVVCNFDLHQSLLVTGKLDSNNSLDSSWELFSLSQGVKFLLPINIKHTLIVNECCC